METVYIESTIPSYLYSRTPHQTSAMKDTIVQEVREARAAVAADFDCDLGKFFAWAKAHTTAERKARHPLPTQPATPAKPTRRKTAKAPVK